MYRFLKLPNEIFKLKLSPSAFYLYSRLLLSFKPNKQFIIKLDVIAKWCNMCKATVCKAIRELSDIGLLNKQNSYIIRSGKSVQGQNKYILSSVGTNFTIIEASILRKVERDDKTTFMVYCCIKKCSNQNSRAFPSITNIQNDTGLSRQTVISKIQFIQDNILIAKSHYTVKSGCYGHNNYTLISTKLRHFFIALISRISSISIDSSVIDSIINTNYLQACYTMKNAFSYTISIAISILIITAFILFSSA